MHLQLEQKPSKSHVILTSIENAIDTGQLASGSKLQSMRTFSKQFSTSVATVQYAFNKLETKGLIERKAGSGVFVKQTKEPIVNSKINVLIPYSNFFMASDQSGIMARRLYMGMCDSVSFENVNLLPVSKEATVALENIDYKMLEKLDPGAKVVIEGQWYSKLFPFFAKRDIHGIFIGNVNDNNNLALQHDYSSVLTNRQGAIEDAISYLANLGRKRIAVLKCGSTEKSNSFMAGYLNGLKRSLLDFRPELVKAFPTQQMFPSINYQYFKSLILELWRATEFDALLLSIPDISTTAMTILQHDLGLTIPDDVAMMTLHDRMEHVNSPTPITAVEFPWYDIGVECANMAEEKTVQLRSTKFNATIIERESTRKGTGAFVNTKILPEYQNIIA
jgi:DNA-binding transcriptional regulator YhcF (GntR family)